jgi:hypothetical protein
MPDSSIDFEQMLEQESAREARSVKEVVTNTNKSVARQFDARAVLADLGTMENVCNALVNEANALEIKSKAQNMEAVNISGKLQELSKEVAKKCTDFLAPYKRVTSSINGPKKRITDAATQAKSIVNQKIFQYKKQEEIEQAKQQKLINDASEKLQKSLNKQAEEIGIAAPKIAPIKAPKPVTILRGSSGASVHKRGGWKCEIVEPDLVMREYCLPSQMLLNQAVKMGVRKTPGCKIYEDETPVTRSA